ncbi:hypothetical protein ACIBI4_16070 [Streptomyces sp. NPDC050418]|uniref:hypothetical protein n=1 Tax=Streptomyces sp. NPDC050418 TaxID=3365612 RepID=UPI0037AC9DDE
MAETKTETAGTDAAVRNTKEERTAAKLAKRIGAFAKQHGGAEAQLAHVGERGTRIVLVGQDGAWGDAFATSHDVALSAVEKAGVTVHEDFDGEFALRVRTGAYEWKRMAGIQVGGPQNKA